MVRVRGSSDIKNNKKVKIKKTIKKLTNKKSKKLPTEGKG